MNRQHAHRSKRSAIALIVCAQLLATSLWFSANAAFGDLARAWNLEFSSVGALTTAVQAGFIAGTLVFALSGLADAFPASRVFTVCAAVGACANLGFAFLARDFSDAMAARFIVGLSLAGVYPLGMKLVVSWEPGRAGEVLGWLVGMLCIGTALPHGIRAGGGGLSWQAVAGASSILAVVAAIAIFWLGDGPHLPKARGRLQWDAILVVARIREFRAAALAYFGHMWELYAFWAVTPFFVAMVLAPGSRSASAISAWSFAIIAIGGVGCVVGGYLSRRWGSAPIAAVALAGSALCGLLFPFVTGSEVVAAIFLLVWGVMVVADSPQFSALSAQAAPSQVVGSALAIQNCIGFAITIISIQWAASWLESAGAHVAWLLVPGPLLGLIAIFPILRSPVR